MNEYYWSFEKSKEVWFENEETIEKCIEEAKKNNEKKYNLVYIGIKENHIATIDAEYVIDYLREQAYDQHGECSEGWLDNSNEESLELELNKTLQKWLKENNEEPTFGTFSEIYCYDLKTGEKLQVGNTNLNKFECILESVDQKCMKIALESDDFCNTGYCECDKRCKKLNKCEYCMNNFDNYDVACYECENKEEVQ